MEEVTGLKQPPDRHRLYRKKAGPAFRKAKAGLAGGGRQYGPRFLKRSAGKGRLRYDRKLHGAMFGPKYARALAGVASRSQKFGPRYLKRKAGLGAASRKFGPRHLKRRAGAAAPVRFGRRASRGIGRSSGPSWLLKMAERAIKRALKPTKTKNFRNHGFKGVKRRGMTGLAGR